VVAVADGRVSVLHIAGWVALLNPTSRSIDECPSKQGYEMLLPPNPKRPSFIQ
jgi:hypothetical protein